MKLNAEKMTQPRLEPVTTKLQYHNVHGVQDTRLKLTGEP